MKQCTIFDEKSPSSGTHKDQWVLSVDGAARNNPGPAGAGIVLMKNNALLRKEGFFLGKKTNNQAEYLALLVGLFFARQYMQPADHLLIISDSLLLVRQVQGVFKIRNRHLQEYHTLARSLMTGIHAHIEHVLREKNEEADAMANEGIDHGIQLPEQFIQFLHQHAIMFV
ncbi:MAG TPA: ribonuclease HI family protein [Candidatus Bathyarchaeia archaeon]|nr:ribonuclease HI family protein [Candidatus Bathyarchaeia archaeon]